MKYQNQNLNISSKRGFTLIELLMVIAIIGILAGILIPAVGAVRKQANIAASKAQISNYVNAIQQFKGEYGYFPLASGSGDYTINVESDFRNFYETISGRTTSGTTVVNGGNRRSIPFYSFSESDFLEGDSTTDTLADRFDNTDIRIVVDGNGDGEIDVPENVGGSPSGSRTLRAAVSAFVVGDEDNGQPGYTLYE